MKNRIYALILATLIPLSACFSLYKNDECNEIEPLHDPYFMVIRDSKTQSSGLIMPYHFTYYEDLNITGTNQNKTISLKIYSGPSYLGESILINQSVNNIVPLTFQLNKENQTVDLNMSFSLDRCADSTMESYADFSKSKIKPVCLKMQENNITVPYNLKLNDSILNPIFNKQNHEGCTTQIPGTVLSIQINQETFIDFIFDPTLFNL